MSRTRVAPPDYTAGVIPHTTPPIVPETSPARFASLIRRQPAGCRVALLGLADDLGVRLNNGRAGARHGPRAFREALARYGVAEPADWIWPQVFDAGDIVPAEGDDESALLETHRRVGEATRALLDLGLFPLAIGGGHDLTLPFVASVIAWRLQHKKADDIAGVYFDAHLDVRDTIGSGMPFRRLVLDHRVRELHLYGFNPLANAREHVAWFLSHGGAMHDLDDGPFGLPETHPHTRPFFASFDLDVLDASHAPGVSAMNPAGWSVRDAERVCLELGRSPRVRCMDFMELNPEHDVAGRTARVAAHLFLTFLRGFAERAEEPR